MNIDQIIGKLMGDGSIGEEKSALEAWKQETESNIKALEEIQKIASLSNSLQGYEDFNTENAWDSFSSKLENNSAPIKSVKSNSLTIFSLANISRMAAILVVALGSFFVLKHFITPSPVAVEDLIYTSTVKPMDVDLQDGSHVTLDKRSNLKVLDERDVSLIGRAHFDVERNEAKQFKISLPVGEIVVLGTAFTVDATDKTTEVFVSEGSVRYTLGDRTWTLVAGDLVKVNNNEVTVLKGRNDNYDSWKNQRLIFRDNNMVEVVDALARHFKKEIIIENKI